MVKQNQAIQDLLRLWNFFKWVDNARWDWERKQGIKRLLNYTNEAWKKCGYDPIENFEPEHLVLSHWLTYIFDYQMSADIIWKKCFPIMARIVKEFQEGYSVEEILERYKKQERRNGKITLSFSICTEIPFKHRFTTAKQHELDKKVERTLKVLESEFNRDLIELMVRISSYGKENDWVRKVACALYLLTYDAKKDEKEIIDILTDDKKFEDYFSRNCFSRRKNKLKNNLWHKRLWSALRDYLKSGIHQYILRYLEKHRQYDPNVLNRWENPQKYLNQLEVPGDVWNKKFYSIVMKPLIEKLDHKINGPPPKVIRNIYESYRNIFDRYGFYPEQFDVTFDFARIFCDRSLCYICPLYRENKIERLCIGDIISKSKKHCPILAVLGYLQPCCPDNCPVYKKEMLSLCAGII